MESIERVWLTYRFYLKHIVTIATLTVSHCKKMPPKKGKGKGKKKGKGDKKATGPPPPIVQEEEPLNELSKAFYLIQIKVRMSPCVCVCVGVTERERGCVDKVFKLALTYLADTVNVYGYINLFYFTFIEIVCFLLYFFMYLDKDLEDRLSRYQGKCDTLQLQNDELQKQLRQQLEDQEQMITFLKKKGQDQTEAYIDLEEKLAAILKVCAVT